MSDREIILHSLRQVERRERRNRLFKDLSRGLALFLAGPLALRVAGLFVSLAPIIVACVNIAWFAVAAVYSARLIRRKSSLAEAAADVDKRVELKDEIRTAYWFIDNPRKSEWIEGQIQRAAQRIGKLDMDRLYPRVVPNTLYLPACMLLLLGGLSFVPAGSQTGNGTRALLDKLARNLGQIGNQVFQADGSANPVKRAAAPSAVPPLEAAQEVRPGAGWQSPLPGTPAGKSDVPSGNEPFGLEPSGNGSPNPPRVGPPTSLKVQLQKEKLVGQEEERKRQDIQESSKQERSTINYREVPTDLRPAQKDVLNQEWTPTRYRSLIKKYFEAIRPPE